MPLQVINIFNARNLKDFSLTLNPSYNIIYGDNGSGKTTILESIYFLLRARIFRNNKYKSFINSDSQSCTVFSKFSSFIQSDEISKTGGLTPCTTNDFTLGILRSKDNTQPVIHLNKNKISSASQLSHLVILGLITPESFNLLDLGPSIRRKFLDWGVFHVEHDFLNCWKSYKKILINRNNILKNFNLKYGIYASIPNEKLNDINCWSPQLIDCNNKLNQLRQKQLEKIKTIFYKFLETFSISLSGDIKLYYYQGWSSSMTFEEYLSNKISEDFSAGYTRYGTHRGDIIIKYKDHFAKDTLSRGQKKIIVICLILSQFYYLVNNSSNSQHTLLLLDDMDSELDKNNLLKLFEIISSINTQVLATTTDPDKYYFIKEESKMFHVKHE